MTALLCEAGRRTRQHQKSGNRAFSAASALARTSCTSSCAAKQRTSTDGAPVMSSANACPDATKSLIIPSAILSIFTPAYPYKLLIRLITKRIIDLEFFDVPAATRFLWLNRYPDDAKRVLVCCYFGFHPGVVGPESFHLVQFHLTTG